MTRDQICNGLQEISDEAYSRWVHHQYTRDKLIIGIGTYVEEAIKLLKQQEPRLLDFDEVKGIAYEETYRIRSVDCNPVWVEKRDDELTGLQFVLIGWMYEPDGGYSPEDYDFYSVHFGSDIYGELPYKQFGKTWRVWNKLPTMEQRKAMKWK